MRKFVVFIIAACVLVATTLCAIYLPLTHHVDNTSDGYLAYLNGSEMICSVNVKGKYKHYFFRDDIFDGTITVNNAVLGSEFQDIGIRFVFTEESDRTSYNVSIDGQLKKSGDIIMSKQCDTMVISFCYDNENNTETTDEAYRCLIVAPAGTSDAAKNILLKFADTGFLEEFRTWEF